MKTATLTWEPSTGWSSPLPACDSPSTVVFVFGDDLLPRHPEVLEELLDTFPTSVVTGCSTAGQIVDATVRDRVCAVAIAQFDHTYLEQAVATVTSTGQSYLAGQVVGTRLASESLRLVFLLSDGLGVNGTELVDGVQEAVGPGVAITGGLAGDGDRFEHTWVIAHGALEAGKVVAVGFYGEHLLVGAGSQGGWGIFGPERVVTRSHANKLYELDGKPALEIYTAYLGDLASEMPASALLFPLAIRSDGSLDHVVRTVTAVDEADGSMTFAGDIPLGCRARLMRSNADRLVDGASEAATTSGRDLRWGGPALAIAVSCVGRRLILGERTDDEIEATLEGLPTGTDLVGFYSYGEIGPSPGGGAELHNQTMTVTTISES